MFSYPISLAKHRLIDELAHKECTFKPFPLGLTPNIKSLAMWFAFADEPPFPHKNKFFPSSHADLSSFAT